MGRKNPSKFDRCVKDVTRRGGAADPYAVCTAAGTKGKGKRKQKNPGKKAKDFTSGEIDEIVRLSYGNSASVLARMFKTSTSVILGILRKARGKQYPWGERERDRGNPKRRNPPTEAAEAYKDFHGKDSMETVTVKKEVHYHKHLAAAGKLLELEVVSRQGFKVTLSGFKGALLCFNEARTQLYVEGGDQSVKLAEFGISQSQAHEMEVLGEVVAVDYHTTKDHLGSEGGTAIYRHKFKRPYPELQYDVPNEQLIFSGGKYTILDEGIDQ